MHICHLFFTDVLSILMITWHPVNKQECFQDTENPIHQPDIGNWDLVEDAHRRLFTLIWQQNLFKTLNSHECPKHLPHKAQSQNVHEQRNFQELHYFNSLLCCRLSFLSKKTKQIKTKRNSNCWEKPGSRSLFCFQMYQRYQN